MVRIKLQPAIDQLLARQDSSGGFPNRAGGEVRPDAAAWAILALSGSSDHRRSVELAATALAKLQLADGSVPIAKGVPAAFWPTPLAVLAWGSVSLQADACGRAREFLLETEGLHGKRDDGSPLAHDTSLIGWPWTAGTHSWIAPTSYALIALRQTGYGEHARCEDARKMILDRQLDSGGWNYGNTYVYGRLLRPIPDTSGIALAALAGMVHEQAVARSLGYLEEQTPKLRTPLSLGWALIGLTAWRRRPAEADVWIGETLDRSVDSNGYDTATLAILISAALVPPWVARLGGEG